MLRDNLVGLIEPMVSSAGAYSLALCTDRNESSDDRPPNALKIPARQGGIYTLTENGASPLHAEPRQDVLVHLERCWWSVKVQSSELKDHRLRYDGRYLRRPPIAQCRITNISERSVTFRTKDKKLGFWVEVEYSLEEFVDRWAQHISEHYQHGVRYFGLFASRALGQISAALFTILGQKPRPRPRRLAWAVSIKRDFGKDPLLDRKGHRMTWVRRIAPQAAN